MAVRKDNATNKYTQRDEKDKVTFASRSDYLLRSVVLVLVEVAIEEVLLRRRFNLAWVGADALSPSTLANKFKISVKDTTPSSRPISATGEVVPRGGVTLAEAGV